MKVTITPIVIDAFGPVTKGLLKGLEDLEVGGPSKLQHYWERPEYWEDFWGDLGRLTVTQILVKNHQR